MKNPRYTQSIVKRRKITGSFKTLEEKTPFRIFSLKPIARNTMGITNKLGSRIKTAAEHKIDKSINK